MGWIAAAALVAGSPALAHEGGVDARGVVVSADADRISLRTGDGKEQSFGITAQTRVVVEGGTGKLADLKPGMRAVVHARKSGERLEAVSVRAAMPKSPSGRPPAK
jgi:hypothetical protein